MDRTPILDMPYILPQQAQAHVTHNEAIRALDSLVQLTVLDRDLDTPPGGPANGDRYIVGPGATGDWDGHDDDIAAWQDGEWVFHSPLTGWHGWLADEAMYVVWSGTAWQALTSADLASAVGMLGINTTADTTSRLSAKTDAVLFAARDDGDGDVRMNLSKADTSDTASVVFQNDYSGRAEFGLAGTDDFSVKVSADGTDWTEAVSIAAATGAVSFPQTGSLAEIVRGHFTKADPGSVAFTKTGAGAAEIKAGTIVEVNGALVNFASATAIAMPTLVAGTDYAIWVKTDGSVQATTDFVSPPAANARKIGNFHYAPGGNASGAAGGDTTPAINEYSFCDLKWHPACADWRGMALVAGTFWCDIYLCGVNHHTNGTSVNNATIADGSSPPKIPAMFGGDGSAVYSGLTWWQAAEVMQSHGKRMPTYAEFAALAFGVTENQSRGNDAVTTGLGTTNAGSSNADEEFTSKWGMIQSSGCIGIWGGHFGGGAAAAGWANVNGGRGQVYQQANAVGFGADWASGASSGSRSAMWHQTPSASNQYVGLRGCTSHVVQ